MSMTEERSIVIGCDDTSILSSVLTSVKEINSFTANVMSASRASDLINITKSVNPSLIIICFRNNQSLLNDFNAIVKKTETPILCLTRKFERQALCWSPNNIVFTHPLEKAENNESLAATIRSIFLLLKDPANNNSGTFAENAIRAQEQTDDHRNMSRYVLELDQKTEILLSIKDRIKTLFPRVDDPTRSELISIVNSIKASAGNTKLWDDFKLYFEKTNPQFLVLLSKKHPYLTSKDLKYCCYLKMNMSNDDIRNLLGINQESVRTHKYRLKKKMALNKDADLFGYIKSIGEEEPHLVAVS
jgi:DNA-binding CsgD family transcriptional regulator